MRRGTCHEMEKGAGQLWFLLYTANQHAHDHSLAQSLNRRLDHLDDRTQANKDDRVEVRRLEKLKTNRTWAASQ